MKPVGWLGQDADRHEHCYPKHKTIEASADVLAEGFKVVRVGDAVAPHGGSCSKHPSPHGAKVLEGSASVFVNGRPMAREGDTVKCDTGQTAPLLRGRATVVAGDASPNAASATHVDAPAPASTAAAARPVLGPPAPVTPQQRIAELRRKLSLSATGRHTLEVIDRYQVKIAFGSGVGSFYDSRVNQITLERTISADMQLLALVHEANHAEAYHSGTTLQGKELMYSRQQYIDGRIDEEATGELLSLMVVQELCANGVLPPQQATALYNTALKNKFLKAYEAGSRLGMSQLRARDPNASYDALYMAAIEGARKAMRYNVINNGVTSTTGQKYVDFYGNYWDRVDSWAR